jgi:DNA topoisomerase-1
MGKSLVIVESPAKAKTINKYLGKDFVVRSSVGHIRDLPTSGRGKPIDKKANPAGKMGVDPEHGWKAYYEVLPSKEKVLAELQKLAAEADEVYLATDLDREGEAIAWHLREVIGGDPARFKRVTFSEITKTAIQAAFAQPGTLNMSRVNAQQARRFLDRVVGFMLSPLLWKKVARNLSAGRVQSVAVRLVVEREREVKAFVPEEYWEMFADLADAQGTGVRAQVTKFKGEAFKPRSQADSDAAVAVLESASYQIASREDKPSKSKPPAPFITSSLQQAASLRLGFSVKKTMTLAQRLYEAGHITYMRTDSRNLSQDAVNTCRGFIEGQYGPQYLPEKPNVYASSGSAQEAHEAIRPTDVRREPGEIQNLEKDQERLYDLIWRQFVACQMPPAEYDTSAITVAAADYELRARGRVLRFDGFFKILPPVRKKGDDDLELPDLKPGSDVALQKLDPSQHFTKPSARFTEASLVRELEKKSIGRPSTYASIISTIQDRGYVKLVNRRFYAEKMG